MTLQEIKEAVLKGLTVCWSNDSYIVTSGLMIECTTNGHCIGLTWLDGVTLNGKESEFYIKGAK